MQHFKGSSERNKGNQNAVGKDRKLSADLNVLYHILQSSKVSDQRKLTKLGSQKKLKRYLKNHVKLNKEVNTIASMKETKVPEAEKKIVAVNKSKNIIHNRINKAGSTSMMGKNIIVKPKFKSLAHCLRLR